MGVSVTLVSNDATLLECCREILSELFGSEWALRIGTSGDVTSLDGLCVWDFTPGETILPQDLQFSRTRRHWFLLQGQDLTALQAAVGTTDFNVLLKPVQRAALRALFSEANRPGKKQNGDSAGLEDVLRIERDEMLRFLIQANLKVQESDQERNNFLARSVHDFRAPLTAISGYCGMLLEEEPGPLTPEQRKVLERMLCSASRLERLCNGMFQLSLPHHVDHRLKLERDDLGDCLDQAIHEVALPLADKRISVAVEIAPGADGLLFEKSQIEQALVNLLDNACRFTPRDGMIEIRGYPFFWERRTRQAASLDRALERHAGRVEPFNSFRVDIRDSGPGIPAGYADRIFEPYTAYGGGQDRSGGGLGLAICRMILNRHQGHIWAESSQLGGLFSFVLPFQTKPAPLAEADNRLDKASLIGTVEI